MSKSSSGVGVERSATRPVPPTAVIGLGDIGSGVATALLEAGVDVTACDVREEALERFRDGARVTTSSPAEAARHSEVLLVAVVDDAQVRSVVGGTDGVLAAGIPGRTVVVLSTVAITTVAELAALAAPRDVSVVDCGVSGGPAAAATGELVCMVGGTDEAFARVRPVLDVLGTLVLHMGPLGAGLSAKLARNVVQYGSWLAAYEAQVLAEAAGIRLPLLAQAIRESDKRIGGASTLMFRETARPLTPEDPADAGLVGPMGAASRLAHKDLQAALALGRSVGVELALTALTDHLCRRIFGFEGGPEDGITGDAGLGAAGEDTRTPRARGIAKMQEVYGFTVDPDALPGDYAAFTVDHLFGTVWTRPDLGVGQRRLLTIGALAALGQPELLEIQFRSALERGELDVAQVREVVLHLTHYVGWPLSTSMNGAAERVIARFEEKAGGERPGHGR